jgi:prevent-host-death family protein
VPTKGRPLSAQYPLAPKPAPLRLFASPQLDRTAAHIGLDIVTRRDDHLIMKMVRIAELKARLSEYLRGVQRGHVLTVMDRDTPIARIIPYEKEPSTLTVRPPLPDATKLAAIRMPPPLALKTDVVKLLAEECGDR